MDVEVMGAEPFFLLNNEEAADQLAAILTAVIINVKPTVDYAATYSLLREMLIVGADRFEAEEVGAKIRVTAEKAFRKGRH